ncbi:calcineurin-like phosphoesterase family protein [Pedobacter sp. SYSU D00535]|uniref:calcineurin-like phosphoesterase C-terminal domain-containing protein n=1 Tax=Pedobacter sp. SYSU D00535 TaxID=2810308 RepID=UPI001A975FE8|nr:calcineurin-like phosphoesterase family protein [Pedobacter sp. SYSU D00535]
MKALNVIIAGMLLSYGAYAQETAKGYIYTDKNGNGKREKSEAGISGVAVTNGKEVVLSDKKGYYELPVSEDQIISVIKPSGYKVRVDENQLPQFFYNHKPAGSPALKYKGVAPTGKLPASIDFALSPAKEDPNFTALIFGDPQPYTLQEVDYFDRGIVAEVAGIKNVAFGLSMGDLVGNDPDLFMPYIKAVKKVGIPWYNLLGNHDVNFDVKEDKYSDESYEAHFGPANYAFNYGNVHFIVLDDILYPDPRDGKSYWGGLREDQLEFVANDLKFVPKDKLIVIAFHIPIDQAGNNEAFREADRIKLFELLADFPNTLSLSAHTHNQKQIFFHKKDGWKQEKAHHHYNVGTTSGNWYSGELNEQGIPVSTMSDGTPKGYAFINFKGNQYDVDYKAAGKPKAYQIELSAPKVVEHKARTSAGIYANFFMGSENDKVEFRIDDGTWKKMVYMPESDPSFLDVLHKWDHTETLLSGRRPSNAAECKHLWRAAVPTNLKPGEHTIEVKATDMYGKTFTQTKKYTILEKTSTASNLK